MPRYDPGLASRTPHRTSFHPDEDKILWQLERMRPAALDLHPKDFGWGTLQTYLVGLALEAGEAAGLYRAGWETAFREASSPGFGRVLRTGRAVSALFALLTLPLCYLLARRGGGPEAGVWAVLLLAVAPLHVLHSHFLTADVAVAFWIVLFVLLLDRSLAGAALVLGLALATKPGAIVLAPLFAAACLRAPWRRAALALLLVAVGYLAGEPYAALAPADWWPPTRQILLRSVAPGPESFPPLELLARHCAQLALYGLGPFGLALALDGLRRSGSPLTAAVGMLWAALALTRFPMGRYELPLVPLLAVAAGQGLAARPARARLALGALAAVPALVLSVSQTRLLAAPHPWQQAADWIAAHVETGGSVARVWAEYPLLDPGRFRLVAIEDPFGLEGRPPVPPSADCVVVDDLPLHPLRADLARDLATRYELQARFRSPPRFGPLEIPEPGAPHDWRYTHPEVRIYRKRAD